MLRIIGCTVDDIEEFCDDCPYKDTLTDCQAYRNRYGAKEVWSDD